MTASIKNLEEWVTDLDVYRKKYNLTRREAMAILEDKEGLRDKLRNFKRFEQFMATVKVLEGMKTDTITGFAG